MPRVQRTPPTEKDVANVSHVLPEPDASLTPDASNISMRPKRPRLNSSPEIERFNPITTEVLEIIRQEIRAIMCTEITSNIKTCISEELRDMREFCRDLKQSVAFMSDEFDRVQTELEICKDSNKNLCKENLDLKKTVLDLSTRVNLMEQYSRQKNVEINGVPENKAELLSKMVVQMGNVVSCPLKDGDIVSAVRVRKLDPTSNNPRAVVVKLNNTQTRDALLVSVMKYNKAHPTSKLNSGHLGYGGTIKPIYVGEHLSPLNKQIHAATRKAASSKGYKYVWVRDGKILMRKADGEQAIHIKSLDAVSLL